MKAQSAKLARPSQAERCAKARAGSRDFVWLSYSHFDDSAGRWQSGSLSRTMARQKDFIFHAAADECSNEWKDRRMRGVRNGFASVVDYGSVGRCATLLEAGSSLPAPPSFHSISHMAADALQVFTIRHEVIPSMSSSPERILADAPNR